MVTNPLHAPLSCIYKKQKFIRYFVKKKSCPHIHSDCDSKNKVYIS